MPTLCRWLVDSLLLGEHLQFCSRSVAATHYLLGVAGSATAVAGLGLPGRRARDALWAAEASNLSVAAFIASWFRGSSSDAASWSEWTGGLL